MIFLERCTGSLKVARVCKAGGSNWSELWECEMSLIEFENVASDWSMGEQDTVSDTAWDNADLVWANKERAKFCKNVKNTVLKNDQEVAVCGVKCRSLVHGLASRKDEDPDTLLHCWIASTGDQMQRVNPVDRRIKVEGIPSKLIWYLL